MGEDLDPDLAQCKCGEPTEPGKIYCYNCGLEEEMQEDEDDDKD